MLVEWLWEIKENIDRHGIRWGLVFAFYALFRKERRNYRLDRRDDAIFHNQKVIMDHLGLSDQFIGQVSASQADLQSFKKYYSLLRKAIQWVSQLRRERVMNQTVNLSVLFLAIAGAIKLILQPFGIDLSGVTDESVNAIANGVGAVFAIIGIIRNNLKGKSDAAAKPVRPQDVDPDTYVQGG